LEDPVNNQLYPGEYEALMEEGMNCKVQSLTREHTQAETKTQLTFLLKGLLKCSACESFMTPHYTQKRHKDGSVYWISYYRCTKTMHQNDALRTIKHLNADQTEQQVIQYLADLNQNVDWVKGSVEDLNHNQREKVRPLEQESIRLTAKLDQLEREIDRFVHGMGQGTVSVKRLEQEMRQREKGQQAMKAPYEAVQRQITEQTARDYDAEVVLRNLQNFRKVFDSLTPQKRADVPLCLIKNIIVYPDKLVLNIFELAELTPGSQKRKDGSWSHHRPS
jgi:hypothetical protein